MHWTISELHKSVRGSRTDASSKNPEAPHHARKKYERMERIPLPKPEELAVSLSDVLLKRSSTATFQKKSISLRELGTLFGHALRKRNGSYPYPSGGGRYPLETYFLGRLDVEHGLFLYHYDAEAHALETLWQYEKKDLSDITSQPTPLPNHLIILTARWHASASKYGNFAYYLGMIEAGHMGQNIQLVGAALDIPSRPIGGFSDEKLEKLLDINSDSEQVVYVIGL